MSFSQTFSQVRNNIIFTRGTRARARRGLPAIVRTIVAFVRRRFDCRAIFSNSGKEPLARFTYASTNLVYRPSRAARCAYLPAIFLSGESPRENIYGGERKTSIAREREREGANTEALLVLSCQNPARGATASH